MKPDEMFTPQEVQEAKKRVKRRKEFYRHLMVFVIVNAFLFLINLSTSPFHWWFLYPLLGWGMGVVFHYVEVFGIPGFNILTKEWEQEQMQRELHQIHYEKYNQRKQLREPEQLGAEELELPVMQKKYDESELV